MLWSRRTGEYIKSLRERRNLNHNTGGPPFEHGDVVLIKSDECNGHVEHWRCGEVDQRKRRDRLRSEIEGR